MSKIIKANKVTIKGSLIVNEDKTIQIDIGDDAEELVDVASQIDFLSGAEVVLTVSQNTEIA